MNADVLKQISVAVQARIEERKKTLSPRTLEDRAKSSRAPHDFGEVFLTPRKTHILAEVKFRSPALGALGTPSSDEAVRIAGVYLASGAHAISVLTEKDYFQGSPEYLMKIREAFPEARLLMKDFFLEEYQILEARAQGADAILLIVALLGEARTQSLLQFALSLGLTTLVEVHDEAELKFASKLQECLIGVNNRDLKTLKTSLECSVSLARFLPKNRVVLSESGINTREDILKLQTLGYRGFLVGGALMQTGDPGLSLQRLCGEPQ
jgi:indole-3-glycerol phosphate synthase